MWEMSAETNSYAGLRLVKREMGTPVGRLRAMHDADPWQRYKHALAGEPWPAAFVDLDAIEANLERLLAPARAAGKRVRLASKSLRCPQLLRTIADRAG